MLADILVLASIYILLASGYVIVYRTSRVLNFAHGDVFMVTGYLLFAVVAGLALDPVAAFPLAIVLGAAGGILLYLLLMAPMAGHPVFAAVLVTIGLGIIVRGLALIGFSGQVLYPGRLLAFKNPGVRFFEGFSMTRIEIMIVLSAFTIVAGLWAFFRYSTLGIQMRAASLDARLAAYRGINIHLLFAVAWAIATAIAMYCGALYSLNYQVTPALTVIGLKALAVSLVGGMDSLTGTIPAGLLVGALEIVVQQQLGPLLSEAIPFFVLVVVLLLRPWGLLGTKEMIDRI